MCNKDQAAIRRLQKMDKLLNEGDYRGALGFHPHKTDEEERDDLLPKPTMIRPDGARVWCVG